jgi:hypothetical protein
MLIVGGFKFTIVYKRAVGRMFSIKHSPIVLQSRLQAGLTDSI